MIGEFIGKNYDNYYGLDVALNGLSYVFYILVLQDKVFKISTKYILILTLPLLIILGVAYYTLEDAMHKLGAFSVNFYVIALGVFALASIALFINDRSKLNMYLLIASVFAVITSVTNAVIVNNYHAFLEILINITFISTHFFMFLYVVNFKEELYLQTNNIQDL